MTDEEKIQETRAAGIDAYGADTMSWITDDELLWLADDKLPKDGRPVRSVKAYMSKIFADTPDIDTLLAGLAVDDDSSDDEDEQPYPPCPRCGGMRAEVDPQRHACAACVRECTADARNPDMIQAVTNDLKFFTGKTVDDEWASRVAFHILSSSNGRVPHPVAYVRSTLHMEKDLSRFLPTPTPPRIGAAA